MEKKLTIALILALSVLCMLLLTEHIAPTHHEKYEPDSLPTQPKADKPAQPVKEITLKRQ